MMASAVYRYCRRRIVVVDLVVVVIVAVTVIRRRVAVDSDFVVKTHVMTFSKVVTSPSGSTNHKAT